MKCIAALFLFYFSIAVPGYAQKAPGERNVRLKVMSYNVHHCNPPSKPGLIDVDAIADAIRKQNPDVVALQEIDVLTNRSFKINQAAMLAEKLSMHFFFAKAIDHDGGEYGVAILSKYPLSEQQIHPLPTIAETRGEPRVFATVMVSVDKDRKFQFGCTHLDALESDTNRILQARAINRITEDATHPIIIAGDFNAEPGAEPISIIDQNFVRTCSKCDFTIPVIHPDKAIDFIAWKKGSKVKLVSHKVIPERYASDHLPVVATLEVEW